MALIYNTIDSRMCGNVVLSMRYYLTLLLLVQLSFGPALSGQTVTPPTSLDGNAYQFSIGGDYTWSVPMELVFSSASYDEGFAGSLMHAAKSYSYANGWVTTDEGDQLRLTFLTASTGTYEFWESDDGALELDEQGTFIEVSPGLALKEDWQHTETMDSALSTDYWNIEQRSVDSLEYASGELSFLFEDDTYSSDNAGEFDINYARNLPMNENWQVVLDDIFVSDTVGWFNFQLDLEVAAGTNFEAGLNMRMKMGHLLFVS